MVTRAKKPHPRKKRTTKPVEEEPAAVPQVPEEEASQDAPFPEPSRQEIPSYSEPIVSAHEEDEESELLSHRPALEPTAFAQAAVDAGQSLPKKSSAKRADAFQESSDEPDFGLGIGDILRSDEHMKAAKAARQERQSRTDDDSRLSIDSILRGDVLSAGVATAAARAPEAEEEMNYMDPEVAEAERSGGRTAALVVLVLLLFIAAAGGVYMFLAKSGLPGLGKSSGNQKAPLTDTAADAMPQAPSSVSVTVLVGTVAPATPGAKPYVASRVIESDSKSSGTFPATGAASSKIDKSVGKVTISNTTGNEFTFVATTRLLSKEGVLFRMTTTTPIPANGNVTVDVRADQAGAEGDIGPSTFVIPGLPPDLQKQITGKSAAAMTGGSGTGKGVSQADIDAAKAALTDSLRKEAVDNFSAMLNAGEMANSDMITAKEISVTAPRVGTPGESFTLGLSLRFSALLVPEKTVTPLLTQAMTEILPSTLNANDYSLGKYVYTVQAYDTAAGTAEVRVDAPIIGR